MSIFSFWKSNTALQGQAESGIRARTRKLVESGGVHIFDARRIVAIAAQLEAGTQSREIDVTKAVKEISGLADRAQVDRTAFRYRRDGLNGGDLIFVDELRVLIAEFDKPQTEPMGVTALESEIDRLAAEMNEKLTALEKLKAETLPAAGPATPPAATKPAIDFEAINARSEEEWGRNLSDCQSRYPSFEAYAARKRYDAKNPGK